jgi:PIN domain nuclease of toxin-antitoxin system
VLLLDTHAWIWSVQGDTRRIGRRARQALGRAESAERIRVSPVSLFEVAALCTAGRLRLASPADRWVREALEAAGVRIAEITAAVAADAGAIPRAALEDPMDRLLVATARQLGATLLTADARVLDYAAATGNVRVQNAAV